MEELHSPLHECGPSTSRRLMPPSTEPSCGLSDLAYLRTRVTENVRRYPPILRQRGGLACGWMIASVRTCSTLSRAFGEGSLYWHHLCLTPFSHGGAAHGPETLLHVIVLMMWQSWTVQRSLIEVSSNEGEGGKGGQIQGSSRLTRAEGKIMLLPTLWGMLHTLTMRVSCRDHHRRVGGDDDGPR